jgi:hypothetical protein
MLDCGAVPLRSCALQACMEKRQGRTYGPPGGRTMAIFVDDIAMPAINEWGDQARTTHVHPVVSVRRPVSPSCQPHQSAKI